LFNDKEADELFVLDIGARRRNERPQFDLLRDLAGECFMPLCYGGGIRTLSQARRIVAAGVEKIALNSSAIDQPRLLSELSGELGASSVVGAIDVRRDWLGRPRVFHPGRRRTIGAAPAEHAAALVRAGAGELFINSVDRDGTYTGFDTALIRSIAAAVNVPLIACGGAAGLDDMRAAIEAGASAAAAGSMFVFYGPHRAVLISYPAYAAVRQLFAA
jgi:cyclase